MIKSLRVILWDEEIGRLMWDARKRMAYFMYNPEFVKRGLNIAPLVAPIDRGITVFWGEEAKVYQKLPSFVADSLPDAWGNQLFDLWRQQNHLSNADITPLDKLAFIGRRGMGALEYQPEVTHDRMAGKIDVRSLADLAERIYTEREKAHILPKESVTLQSLLTVGTSAGGRQPKAIIAIDKETGEIRSGQMGGMKGYDYFLLKFGDSRYSSAELEMTYYEMATKAGIRMMPSRLYSVDGNNHFLTKRFDREGERKMHIQTLAAICPEADSYEQLMAVCRKLHLPESDCQELFRRMVFNILANNTDDHIKNFSFLMQEDGSWRLSPAYDITYIIDTGGYLPNESHCLYIRAKLRDITRDDVIQFARDNGIRRPDAIICDVVESLKQFRSIAIGYGVSEQWTGRVEATIFDHLRAWGEWENQSSDMVINGHTVTDFHLEQQFKGNYCLQAVVDGRTRKYIIRKGTPDHDVITQTGLANLTEVMRQDLVARFCVGD